MKKLLVRIIQTVSKYAPVMCARCFSIHFEKTMKYEWNTLGKQVALCAKCHEELFTPFSGGDK